jgi:hypothetical protein
MTLIFALVCQAILSLIVLITFIAEEESNTAVNVIMAILFGIPLAYIIAQL